MCPEGQCHFSGTTVTMASTVEEICAQRDMSPGGTRSLQRRLVSKIEAKHFLTHVKIGGAISEMFESHFVAEPRI